MSVTHDRMRSGRVAARRWTWPPPQSWPTRSIGPVAAARARRPATPGSRRSSPPKPSGSGAPKPGGDRATTSSRPSAASSGSQMAAVSGLPWTKTTVIGDELQESGAVGTVRRGRAGPARASSSTRSNTPGRANSVRRAGRGTRASRRTSAARPRRRGGAPARAAAICASGVGSSVDAVDGRPHLGIRPRSSAPVASCHGSSCVLGGGVERQRQRGRIVEVAAHGVADRPPCAAARASCPARPTGSCRRRRRRSSGCRSPPACRRRRSAGCGRRRRSSSPCR